MSHIKYVCTKYWGAFPTASPNQIIEGRTDWINNIKPWTGLSVKESIKMI